MYHKKPVDPQLCLAFQMPFGGQLNPDNRWVKRASTIPWSQIEDLYATKFPSDRGKGAMHARISFGALMIKTYLGCSDRETLEQITENPFLQFFLGYDAFQEQAPFDPCMMTHFRKRWDASLMAQANELIVAYNLPPCGQDQDSDHSNPPTDQNPSRDQAPPQDTTPGSPASPTTPGCPATPDPQPTHGGKLLVDATCAPADITYPTDLKLLNAARELTEQMIDTMHAPRIGQKKKPRTYRKKARKQFLAAALKKRLKTKRLRAALRQQLGYVKRNLKTIKTLADEGYLKELSASQYRKLLTIGTAYEQQQQMYDTKSRRVPGRIVSISQPHVRPIPRGKAGASTEFGAKLSLSLVRGLSFVDRLDWDQYNECKDLIEQVERYRERFGMYPESVHADKIYQTRENRAYCKNKGIRMTGAKLGRPIKETAENKAALKAAQKQRRQDEIDRNEVEGKFGQGKRRYGIGLVMAKLRETSESWVHMTFVVMNVERLLFFYACIVCRAWAGDTTPAGIPGAGGGRRVSEKQKLWALGPLAPRAPSGGGPDISFGRQKIAVKSASSI